MQIIIIATYLYFYLAKKAMSSMWLSLPYRDLISTIPPEYFSEIVSCRTAPEEILLPLLLWKQCN